jgi:hypothetical protein
MADGPWFAPELSLPTQFDMARDRRALAQMHRDGLAQQADRLLVAWYQNRAALQNAAKEIASLQCRLALAQQPCTQGLNPPRAEHYQWAEEVLRIGAGHATPNHS